MGRRKVITKKETLAIARGLPFLILIVVVVSVVGAVVKWVTEFLSTLEGKVTAGCIFVAVILGVVLYLRRKHSARKSVPEVTWTLTTPQKDGSELVRFYGPLGDLGSATIPAKVPKEPESPTPSFYDKFGEPKIRTKDGHFVRSNSERIIDDYFFVNDIPHVYEAKIPTDKTVLCDFYLPKTNTYVEFWGLSDIDQYKERMNVKHNIYERNNLNLISLFPEDLEQDLGKVLEEQLQRFGKDLVRKRQYKKKNPDFLNTYNRFVSVDFETANNAKNSAISIGLVEVREGVIQDIFSSLIKPPEGVFLYSGYNGITEDMVASEKTFLELWPSISKYFQEVDFIVAHNAKFDSEVLWSTCEHYGIERPQAGFFCTMVESRRLLPTLPDHKLNTLASHFGVPLNHHEALSDARASAEIFLRLQKAATDS